jgi:NTP pyrophosphatase (non-canonical NTP hydrolase)
VKLNSHKQIRSDRDVESIHSLPFEYDPTPLKENEGYFYTRGMEINMLLNQYAAACHNANRKWWTDLQTGEYPIKRNVGEMLMLCVSELAEAMEGHRKDLQDDKLPQYKMFDVELVDCLIRIFDLAGAHEINLDKVFEEKMLYNSKRQDHTIEARLAEGGKKY